MKNLLTMSQYTDHALRPSPPGSSRDRRQCAIALSVIHGLETPGRKTVLGDELTRGLASQRNTCVQARPIADGRWFYTPKFGNNDHFQRRCAT